MFRRKLFIQILWQICQAMKAVLNYPFTHKGTESLLGERAFSEACNVMRYEGWVLQHI